MNNSITTDMSQRIPQQSYEETSSVKIRGTLLEKDGNNVKIDIGNNRVLEMEVGENIEGEIGDTVVIDKGNIVKSKLHHIKEKEEDVSLPLQISDGEAILESLNLPINEESKEALRILGEYGIDITRENLLYFLQSKANLGKLIQGLDYETAIRLMEDNIDIGEKSLEEIVNIIGENRKEEQGFSLLRFFMSRNKMTVDEAEKIALQLYGNRMGKDITDIIRALSKAGLEVNKINIERVNSIFNKLDNLQDIEEATIIDSIRNKIEASIDNLYKLKNSITKNVIEIDGKLSQIGSRAYEGILSQTSRVTSEDLVAMEGSIKSILTSSGMEVTGRAMELAKELIRKGIEVTRENVERVDGVKLALVNLKDSLTYEKTAQIIKAGIQLEREDVVRLSKFADEIPQGPSPRAVGGQEETREFQGIDRLVESMQLIGKNQKTILPLLIKNAIPVKLREINNMQLLLNNEKQIANELENIIKIVEKSQRRELQVLEREIKDYLFKLTEDIKSGKFKTERVYRQIGEWLEEVGDKAYLLGKGERDLLGRTSTRLRDSIELQNQLNRGDTLLQIPIIMDKQLKNLQVFIMNKKRARKKIDPDNMSILLNFDTNNMGNINIYTSVRYKRVVMKVGVKSHEDRELFQRNQKIIEGLLSDLGYELKDMDFRVEEEQNLLTMVNEIPVTYRPIRSLLDIRI